MRKNKVLTQEQVYPALHQRLDFVEELMLMKVPANKALPVYLDWCEASGSVTGSRQLFINDKDRVFQRNHQARVGKREQHEMSKRSWKILELDYNQYRNYENGQSSAVLGAIRTSAEMEKLLDAEKAGEATINFNFNVNTGEFTGSLTDIIKNDH